MATLYCSQLYYIVHLQENIRTHPKVGRWKGRGEFHKPNTSVFKRKCKAKLFKTEFPEGLGEGSKKILILDPLSCIIQDGSGLDVII